MKVPTFLVPFDAKMAGRSRTQENSNVAGTIGAQTPRQFKVIFDYAHGK